MLHQTDVPISGQVAIGGTAALMACSSTLLLNYCISPYVYRIETTQDEEVCAATTGTFFGTITKTEFKVADIVDPGKGMLRPFCNFSANGAPFFVHPELLPPKSKLLLALPKRN
jgi:hypothetical protein